MLTNRCLDMHTWLLIPPRMSNSAQHYAMGLRARCICRFNSRSITKSVAFKTDFHFARYLHGAVGPIYVCIGVCILVTILMRSNDLISQPCGRYVMSP